MAWWSWELAFILGAIVLGLGIAYGFWQSRTRNRALDRLADQVVRDRYENPGKWDGKSK